MVWRLNRFLDGIAPVRLVTNAILIGLKRCLRIKSPRLAYNDLETWSNSARELLGLLENSETVNYWTNDTCDAVVHFDVVPKGVRQPMELCVYQNLLALWGIYEKEIEKFHRPQRRHPRNPNAISLRFGDGGPADRYPAIRDDTPVGRAAYAREVYATPTLRELHNLVHSSLAQGNRKVGIPSSTPEAPGSGVSFRELGSTMNWGQVSMWCAFVCFMLRFAHWLEYKSFSFFVYGVIDIEDLPELINLPRKFRRALVIFCRRFDKHELARPSIRAQDSQGGPRDIPPDHWIRRELEAFNALGVPDDPPAHNAPGPGRQPVTVPDLTGDIHPLFREGAWDNVEPPQLDSLRQACLLASRLLEFATPWFASLLPTANHSRTNTANPSATTIKVPMIANPTPRTLDLVRRALTEMADSVRISASPDLLARRGVWSHHQRAPRDGLPNQPVKLYLQEHRDRDRTEQETLGYTKRPVQIIIASQLLQAALPAVPATADHHFAVFYLAVVLVSEMGHAAWLTDFDNVFLDDVRLDNDVYPDLGVSLIGWILGGWWPRPSRLDENDENRDDYHHVREGLHWNKLFKRTMQRPLFATIYSIPVHYIQRILTQERWDEVVRAKERPAMTRRFLKPETPFQQRHTARVARQHRREDDWGKGAGQANYYEDLDWEVTPPPEWDVVELGAAGAVGCNVSPLGLAVDIHSIFAYENWTRAPANYEERAAPGTSSVTEDEYDRLRPAMMLATLLLTVGTSWFTSLMPQIRLATNLSRGSRELSAVRAPGADDLAAARAQLEGMAGHVHFDHNALQLPEDGHLGHCSRGYRHSSDREGNYKYQACDPAQHEHFDDLEQNHAHLPHRRTQISVSTQVVRAVLDSARDSERYLQAVYSLATTLTHELAHAALYTNFAWSMIDRNPPIRGEAQAELGHSLIAWLHGGWVLSDSTSLDDNGTATFRHGASWRKWHRVLQPDEYVPRYWTYYSIPVSFIQRMFVQAEWDRFDLDGAPELAANALLRPRWPFRRPGHARRAERTSYEFWSVRGYPDEWYEDEEPAVDDDRVDPYYVDEDWDDGPGLGA